MGRPRFALALVALLLAPALTGCLELQVASVPDKFLEGRGGNGWAKNASSSQSEADSAQLGFVKSQTLVYEDRTSSVGYDGSLTVSTLRTLLRPSEESLLDELQDKVRTEAESKGIRIDAGPTTGTRPLLNGAESFWFTYNGTVTQQGFFSRNARVKILGEVWQCVDEKTVVVAIGLAQITDTRFVGGVPVADNRDETTWREIVSDPRGHIDGQRGSNGLVYNVQC